MQAHGQTLTADQNASRRHESATSQRVRLSCLRVFVAASYLGGFVVLACSLAGCQRPPGQMAPSATPPALNVAVGPVPGPGDDAPKPNNPYSGDREAMGQGYRLYVRMNCSGCHGDHGGGGMGPSLRDIDWIYGSSDGQVFDSIAHGRGHGMPTWGTKMNEDDIWKLVAYIKSMRTPNEISPPS